MAIRIRTQRFPIGAKKASVEIISVDQFTRRARLAYKGKERTEREHLLEVLDSFPEDPYILLTEKSGTRSLYFMEHR